MCNFIYEVSGSLISFFFLWIEIRVSQFFCRKLQVFVDPLLSNLFSCIYGFYADLLLLHKRNVNSLFIISEKISTTFLKLPLLHKIFPTKIPKLQFKSCTEYCQIGFKEKTWQCVDTQLIEVNKSAGKFKQKFQIFSRNKWENGVQYEEGKCIVLFTKPTKIQFLFCLTLSVVDQVAVAKWFRGVKSWVDQETICIWRLQYQKMKKISGIIKKNCTR